MPNASWVQWAVGAGRGSVAVGRGRHELCACLCIPHQLQEMHS